ncbi:uncharacterized protein LOC132199513 isoform X2 [Neocloeon triangulifer]|uniref:uncharacterized protein LOC132199513 isoform X2 n=1 Tax=Neocloeon triangulifer TaxID=2078957 RepID=UPI00286F4CC2|nr:uncharacterized protein LOC132199513 isoform X2 [Neocloeon triangulifer]
MSSSIVWKNLQLFDQAEVAKEGKKGKKKVDKKELLISVERRGVKKNTKKAKEELFKQKSTILGEKGLLLPSLKHSGPKFEEENEDQIVEENLKRFQSLSQIAALDLKTADKILERTTRSTKRRVKLAESEKPDTSSTIFTEADFAKFAKNYVPDA